MTRSVPSMKSNRTASASDACWPATRAMRWTSSTLSLISVVIAGIAKCRKAASWPTKKNTPTPKTSIIGITTTCIAIVICRTTKRQSISTWFNASCVRIGITIPTWTLRRPAITLMINICSFVELVSKQKILNLRRCSWEINNTFLEPLRISSTNRNLRKSLPWRDRSFLRRTLKSSWPA